MQKLASEGAWNVHCWYLEAVRGKWSTRLKTTGDNGHQTQGDKDGAQDTFQFSRSHQVGGGAAEN
jgi:hypothetical protein